jgi:hypothetical protein
MRWSGLFLVGSAIGALVACGRVEQQGSVETQQPQPITTCTFTSTCDLVTPAQLNAATGRNFYPGAVSIQQQSAFSRDASAPGESDGRATCTFASTDDAETVAISFQCPDSNDPGAVKQEMEEDSFDSVPVTGVGDFAEWMAQFSDIDAFPSGYADVSRLDVLSGDHYFGIEIVSPISASTKMDSAEAIARDVIANL